MSKPNFRRRSSCCSAQTEPPYTEEPVAQGDQTADLSYRFHTALERKLQTRHGVPILDLPSYQAKYGSDRNIYMLLDGATGERYKAGAGAAIDLFHW